PVFVDLTPPAVTLTVPSTTTIAALQVSVTATDAYVLPDGTPVALDVDLNNDGSFTGPGETGYMVASLTGRKAVFKISPALPLPPARLRLGLPDLAGNEGTCYGSATTVTVQPPPGPWTISDTTPLGDPFEGDPLAQRGDLNLSHDLDLDQSPGTAVAGSPALS